MRPTNNKGQFVRTGKMVHCNYCAKLIYKSGWKIKKFKKFYCCVKHQKLDWISPPQFNHTGEKLSKYRVEQLKKRMKDEKHPQWKGAKVSYSGLHRWIKRKLGKPKKCNHCGTIKGRIEFANKSHQYKRDLTDWIPLCVPCHRKYDRQKKGQIKKYYVGDTRI